MTAKRWTGLALMLFPTLAAWGYMAVTVGWWVLAPIVMIGMFAVGIAMLKEEG